MKFGTMINGDIMTEKRFIITFETIIETEDLYNAVTIGNKLEKKYKEDNLNLQGVRIE